MNNSDNQEQAVLQVPIEDITPNRNQPRLVFDDKSLNELANSIKEHGIIQPLVLRRNGEKYEIVAGERRYRAAKLAGLAGVPAIITTISDDKSAEVAIVENIQRKDLTAIEEARSFKAILDKGEVSQADLAKRMGISQSAVSNKLRLLTLDDEVQQAVLEGKISERHARSLLKLSNKEDQKSMLKRVISERLTVKQLETNIKKMVGDVAKINNEDVAEVSKSNDVDPLQLIGSQGKGSDSIATGGKFFNFSEDSVVNMQTENSSDTEKNSELIINTPAQPVINEPVVETPSVEAAEQSPASEGEIEMLGDFFESSAVDDDVISKIKSSLSGLNYEITEEKENDKRIIKIIINN